MSKAIINLWQPVPKCCIECPLLDIRWLNRKEIDFCECRARKGLWVDPYSIREEKPDWCPLEEIKDGSN